MGQTLSPFLYLCLLEGYNVTVLAKSSTRHVVSLPYLVEVQQAVALGRLIINGTGRAVGLLLHHPALFSVSLNRGSEPCFHWDFGDGTVRPGNHSEWHTYWQEGEHKVQVVVWNAVSSVSIFQSVFAVPRPCQPPEVKHRGPQNFTLVCSKPLELAVPLETPSISCSISRVLQYIWHLEDAAGHTIQLSTSVGTNGSHLRVPPRTLPYGPTTALAKIKIVGTPVYSLYVVGFMVVPTPLVANIMGGTHTFVSRTSQVLLDASNSYDPDDTSASNMSFRWNCTVHRYSTESCFKTAKDEQIQDPLATHGPLLTFPASALGPGDLFVMMVTVSRPGRSPATSQRFLTIYDKANAGVQLHCSSCQSSNVQRGNQLKVSAHCPSCPHRTTYSWSLHLVLPLSSKVMSGGFCELTGGPVHSLHGKVDLPPTTTTTAHHAVNNTTYVDRRLVHLQGKKFGPVKFKGVLDETARLRQEDSRQNIWTWPRNGSMLPEKGSYEGSLKIRTAPQPEPERRFNRYQTDSTMNDNIGRSSMIAKYEGNGKVDRQESWSIPPYLQESSSEKQEELWHIPLFHHELNGSQSRSSILHLNITEGQGKREYPLHIPGQYSHRPHFGLYRDVHSEPATLPPGDAVLNYLPWEPLADTIMDRMLPSDLLQTDVANAGQESDTLVIPPFSLQSGQTYMVVATLNSSEEKVELWGRAEMLVQVVEEPTGGSCSIQPPYGKELLTEFGIFCSFSTTQNQPLEYKFSYSLHGSRRQLYRGFNFEHFFLLPAGPADEGYKVTIHIQVRNSLGGQTDVCFKSVVVEPALPFFEPLLGSRSNKQLIKQIYEAVVDPGTNITSLLLLGNPLPLRLYMAVVVGALNRCFHGFMAPDKNSTQWQRAVRARLLHILLGLSIGSQDEFEDTVALLDDIMIIDYQLLGAELAETIQLLDHLANTLSPMESNQFPRQGPWDVTLRWPQIELLVGLVGRTMRSISCQDVDEVVPFIPAALNSLEKLLQSYMHHTGCEEMRVTTEGLTIILGQYWTSSKHIVEAQNVRFHLPVGLGKWIKWHLRSGLCVVVRSFELEVNTKPMEVSRKEVVGSICHLALYSCSGSRKVRILQLPEPIIIELPRQMSQGRHYTLCRKVVNIHELNVGGISQHLKSQALQVTLKFSRPENHPFPVSVLFRCGEKPTPYNFTFQHIFTWNSDGLHFMLTSKEVAESNNCFLALLDATFDQRPPGRWLSQEANYSLVVEWLHCVYWGDKGWMHDACKVHPSANASTVICTCDRTATFSTMVSTVVLSFSSSRVEVFLNPNARLLPGAILLLLLLLGLVCGTASWRADVRGKQARKSILLPGSDPRSQELYAVTVETGCRPNAGTSAKVSIVLHGEDGVSEVQDLWSQDQVLHQRGSQHTFIFSSQHCLGPICKLHLWHNNKGHSPSWFVSQLTVRDLKQRRTWVFPATCWLSTEHGDARVDRHLPASSAELGPMELSRTILTGLAHWHLCSWAWTHVGTGVLTCCQRLALWLCLLASQSAVATVIVASQEDKYEVELGLVSVSLDTLFLGLECSLLALPVIAILTFAFSCSNKITSPMVNGKVSPSEMELQQTLDICFSDASPAGGVLHLDCTPSLPGQISRPSRGCSVLVWALCWSVTLSGTVFTCLLGFRFDPSKILLWSHMLLLSLLGSSFIFQPLLILAVALVLVCKSMQGCQPARVRVCDRNPEAARMPCTAWLSPKNDSVQRRQHLIWQANPPSYSSRQLARHCSRKRVALSCTLSELVIYMPMLSLVVFLAFSKFSSETSSLHKAVHTHFSRWVCQQNLMMSCPS
uniref:Uncharacterized protein n=1 Tax=Eptatretus burgeri TaxID=7764 RepID=A0A8C4NI51_EPTBU